MIQIIKLQEEISKGNIQVNLVEIIFTIKINLIIVLNNYITKDINYLILIILFSYI